MEQRWSVRKPITFEVLIWLKCHPMVRGRSRNIGLEGLFIETGIVTLPVGLGIKVEFGLMTEATGERVCLPAVVIHRSEQGCGIMFHAFNQQVFRSIEQMLYTDHDRPARQRPCLPGIAGIPWH